jgi:hypothetical protein
MSRKRTFWSVALLIGTLLSLVGRVEGMVFEIRPSQNFCYSKLALQVKKWTPRSNDLGYSMKHAVLANNAEWKHKTPSTSISQWLGHTSTDMSEAVYTIELLGGLVGAYSIGYYGGLIISCIVAQLFASDDTYPEVLLGRVGPFIYPPATAVGAATGTSFVGLCLNQKGSFTGALIGSALGAAVGTFIQFGYDSSLLWHLMFPCASIGAVLGYNYKTFFGK